MYQMQPLAEGVRKHTLSVFVADESGLINRVAGVFARRGANIESLAVGLTVDKALFTIVATGTDATVSNLSKQIAKLVNVRYVEEITDMTRVERELMLVKVDAPPGPTRTEVTQVAEIFRARVTDVSDATLTIQATGDPGKMLAFQKAMAKFGLVELVRTGRIALKRGGEVFQGEHEHIEHQIIREQEKILAGKPKGQASSSEDDGDVYSRESKQGVWSVPNVLDAAYSPEVASEGYEASTLQIEVKDVPGVLNQVTGVFARRGYNVQSLAVGNSEQEGMSRITMVVPGNAPGIATLIKQLYKLIHVQKVTELTHVPHVQRELALIKVECTPHQRGEMMALAQIFHGSVVDVSPSTVTLEVTGKQDKMAALQEVLEPYGILEVARTGRVALVRDSGVDSKYLGRVSGSRIML